MGWMLGAAPCTTAGGLQDPHEQRVTTRGWASSPNALQRGRALNAPGGWPRVLPPTALLH